MGLMQKAVETYDKMSSLAGVENEGKKTLAPIGHINKKVNIEITIDIDGNFLSAQKVENTIIIPVTQVSAGRTSSAAKTPHPLCDKAFYMIPSNKDSYEAYIKQLQDWCSSDYSVSQVEAVLKYVEKGTLAKDADGLLSEKADEFICWRVLSDDSTSDDALGRNKEVIDSFTKYYLSIVSTDSPHGICYITGNDLSLAQQHMKGVVPFSANAKIISSNDSKNFTYRGRFVKDDEALTIGYVASQKAHNALKWIVDNDGVSLGGKVFICWNPAGKEIPKPMSPLFGFDNDDDEWTPTDYKDKLYKVIAGYRAALDIDDEAVIAIFEAATNGRLSVTYYGEMSAWDFLERLRHWDETSAWISSKYGVKSPRLIDIIKASCGIQRGNDEKAEIEIDDSVKSAQMQRLLLCRLNKTPLPADIMMSAVQKCSNLQIYNTKNRISQLFTTCAIIKKYRNDHFKEEWNMALEPERNDRSYQYGRLLAVMEKIERDALGKEESRETNAIRMQSVFVKRPMYAFRTVMEQLKNSYYAKLSLVSRTYYDKLIGEITERISSFGDREIGKPLTETYLLGYYLQKNALYTKKNETNDNKTEEEQ